ncbi:hypothetical protein HBI56_022640 [Parastagonospora nodorum]|nr:hypothetical protein HBH53_083830 [Parastagonospora nodorum]KAH3975842.1 hypothetical protein HBH51_081520 [Parastagonospora nodorum]KAH4005885.1 hypothetical protein HBI10_027140 [Parastagonospora nodorum]KAH4023125.1 hypothetical protein HBI13_094750 [Parastagonospora nodorum]KAH4055000.1 hypothetical protein HBH49_070070 [Parastagonospora nodorum]
MIATDKQDIQYLAYKYPASTHYSIQGQPIHDRHMDDKLQEAQEVHAELHEDYGIVPSVKVQNVLDLLEEKYTQDGIEQTYRQFIRDFEDLAYKKLITLRGTFGRCRLVKEHTVLEWMKAIDTEDEMKAKYRRAVRCEEPSDMGTHTQHTMDDILNILESYSQGSDAQIVERVTTAGQSTLEMA